MLVHSHYTVTEALQHGNVLLHSINAALLLNREHNDTHIYEIAHNERPGLVPQRFLSSLLLHAYKPVIRPFPILLFMPDIMLEVHDWIAFVIKIRTNPHDQASQDRAEFDTHFHNILIQKYFSCEFPTLLVFSYSSFFFF